MADSKPLQAESDDGTPLTSEPLASEPLCEYCRKTETKMGDPAFIIDRSLCQCTGLGGQSSGKRDQGLSLMDLDDEHQSIDIQASSHTDETFEREITADSRPHLMESDDSTPLCEYCRKSEISMCDPAFTIDRSLCQCSRFGGQSNVEREQGGPFIPEEKGKIDIYLTKEKAEAKRKREADGGAPGGEIDKRTLFKLRLRQCQAMNTAPTYTITDGPCVKVGRSNCQCAPGKSGEDFHNKGRLISRIVSTRKDEAPKTEKKDESAAPPVESDNRAPPNIRKYQNRRTYVFSGSCSRPVDQSMLQYNRGPTMEEGQNRTVRIARQVPIQKDETSKGENKIEGGAPPAVSGDSTSSRPIQRQYLARPATYANRKSCKVERQPISQRYRGISMKEMQNKNPRSQKDETYKTELMADARPRLAESGHVRGVPPSRLGPPCDYCQEISFDASRCQCNFPLGPTAFDQGPSKKKLEDKNVSLKIRVSSHKDETIEKEIVAESKPPMAKNDNDRPMQDWPDPHPLR